MWFKLVANKDGSIATIEASGESRDEKGRSIHYIEADTKAAAIKIWAARYDKTRRRAQRKYIRNIEASRCNRCGALHSGSEVLCGECKELARSRMVQLQKERNARGCCMYCNNLLGADGTTTMCRYCADRCIARRHGKKPLPPRPVKGSSVPKTEAAKAASAQRARLYSTTGCSTYSGIKRAVYRAALESFDSMAPARYRGWLVAKIQEMQDKIDGKREAAGLPPQHETNTARVIAAALAQPRAKSKARLDTGARKSQ